MIMCYLCYCTVWTLFLILLTAQPFTDLSRCAYGPVCACVCACALVGANVVLMLMRSHSSLAAVSGIEFLLGNRLHIHKHCILITRSHTHAFAQDSDLCTNAFKYA